MQNLAFVEAKREMEYNLFAINNAASWKTSSSGGGGQQGLAAVAEGGERRRYRGMIDGVRGEAGMQNSVFPLVPLMRTRALKLGEGGGLMY